MTKDLQAVLKLKDGTELPFIPVIHLGNVSINTACSTWNGRLRFTDVDICIDVEDTICWWVALRRVKTESVTENHKYNSAMAVLC